MPHDDFVGLLFLSEDLELSNCEYLIMAMGFLDEDEAVEQARLVVERAIDGDMILGVAHYNINDISQQINAQTEAQVKSTLE